MDNDLIAISECLSLYYEVLALITYQSNTQTSLKVSFRFNFLLMIVHQSGSPSSGLDEGYLSRLELIDEN